MATEEDLNQNFPIPKVTRAMKSEADEVGSLRK